VKAGVRKSAGLIVEDASSAAAAPQHEGETVGIMRQLKTGAYIALGLFVFALQFALAYQQPSLGLWSPFPFSVLRSIEMPILLCVAGAVSAFSAKSLVERKLFYSVIAASLAEIAIIKAMVWLDQPLLMLAIFSLNAFMTVQFLRYGLLVSAMNLLEIE
jgi:hypothetical protein